MWGQRVSITLAFFKAASAVADTAHPGRRAERHFACWRGYRSGCRSPRAGVVSAATDRQSWPDDQTTEAHSSLSGMAVTAFQWRSLDSRDD